MSTRTVRLDEEGEAALAEVRRAGGLSVSEGSEALRAMIAARGLGVHFLDAPAVERAFELMDRWADRPMDLADASLVCARRATAHDAC